MNKLIHNLSSVGPAALIAAAFIGPGTITTCTLVGASYGYSLLWALLFSIIATIILQEMSARLGLIGRMGLGEALRHEFSSRAGRFLSIFLVLVAISLGNAAYETGNILGGAMGISAITGIESISLGNTQISIWGMLIGILACILLMSGSYRLIEKGLIGLVILMSITFITTAILVKPDAVAMLKGLFIPGLPRGASITVVGLIGTTIVPYNLFLHASVIRQKNKSETSLSGIRTDNIVSISAGGLISMAVISTSAAAFYNSGLSINDASDMAIQLGPLLGRFSSVFLSTGLLAAGISSAITAPLAAAYASSEILGWDVDIKSNKFRCVMLIILLTGTVFSSLGLKPVKAIFVAQVTNGILLPLVAIFLIRVMNNQRILGRYKNSLIANILGIAVVIIAILLGFKSIAGVFNLL